MRPDSLENKFKLLALLPYDGRVRRKHMLVFGFILDWYHQKYGDALASVRHVHEQLRERDPDKQGASLALIHSALSDLVAWGWLTLEKGSGRRASRYVPVWNKLSVHPVANTTEDNSSVHPGMNAGVHPGMNTTGISVHPVVDEDPLTLTRVPDPGTRVSTDEVPAALGIGAGGAMPADGFGEIWKAYGRHGNKKASRAAWVAIDWSQYDYGPEHVIERARSWADSAKPGQRRMPLEKWLEAERFDEADRAVEPKKASPSKLDSEPPTAANDDNIPDPWLVRITDSDVLSDGLGDRYIQLCLADADLPEITERIAITYEHDDHLVQEGGQRELSDLLSAIGVDGVEDTTELHGKPFLYERTVFGTHKFYPAPESAKETINARS